MNYLSKSEMFSGENDNLYSYLEFIAIKFTYKLRILKFHSGIFVPLRHLPISRLLRHNEMGFETHQNGLRLPHILLPIIYLTIFNQY